MTTYVPGVPPQNRNPQSIGSPLLDDFTLISLASAVEPLRTANQPSGRELYHWHTPDLDGRQVWANDGLQITPDAGTNNTPAADCVVVYGGINTRRSVTREHITFLQTQARQSRRLGAVCIGSWALARTGLLDGHDYSVYWECLVAMQGTFPRVAMSTRLLSIDRNRLASPGDTAPMDMMLHLVGREHGHELSAMISEMFTYERTRNEQDYQRVSLKHMLGTNQPGPQEIVALMEANLEEPIGLDELAVYINVLHRQLERLFQKYLHCSSPHYYLKLHLIRARQLPKQMSVSVIEVALACGFVSTPHFSRCCRECFSIPPRDERQGQPLGQPVVLVPIPQDLALMPNSSVLSALGQAQGESAFASIRIWSRVPAHSIHGAGRALSTPRHQRRQQLSGNRLAHRR